MIYLRQNTARTIVFEMGAYDATDGVTPESALTITGINIYMDLSPADASVAPSVILDNVAGATTGVNALNYHNTASGTLKMALTAGNTAVLGQGTIKLMGAEFCPIVQPYKVLDADVFDSLERGIAPIIDIAQ